MRKIIVIHKRDIKRIILAILIVLVIFILTKAIFIRPKSITISENVVNNVIYKLDTIPIGKKRPGNKLNLKYIVVHNTANPSSTAQNERDYLTNPKNISSTSWHIVVDEKEAIQAVPLNEVAHHSGDSTGNARGIGIEICESGDYYKAEQNAVKLIAYILYESKLPISSIKKHYDFSGKECPRLIIDRWDEFINEIEVELAYLKNKVD